MAYSGTSVQESNDTILQLFLTYHFQTALSWLSLCFSFCPPCCCVKCFTIFRFFLMIPLWHKRSEYKSPIDEDCHVYYSCLPHRCLHWESADEVTVEIMHGGVIWYSQRAVVALGYILHQSAEIDTSDALCAFP